ncbi:MAG: hypothetical protein GX195_05055, partial [Firmicutes bacterium]|nr:hypothetical protein [Bacillota bacterium]
MVLALGRERAQEDLQQAAAGLQVPPVLLVPREQAALLVVQAPQAEVLPELVLPESVPPAVPALVVPERALPVVQAQVLPALQAAPVPQAVRVL